MLDIKTVTPPGIALVLAFALVYAGLSMNSLRWWSQDGYSYCLQSSYKSLISCSGTGSRMYELRDNLGQFIERSSAC